MTTPLVGSDGGLTGSFLPATGFGPGSIIIAVIGGVLTLSGVISRHVARHHGAG